jgi:chorismate mutase
MMHHRGRVSGSNIATSSSAEKMGAVASASPWATSASSSELSARFDAIDKNLTVLITERTNLVDESSRLHQRGGKTLRERSRLAAVELRLSELEREISTDRKQLAARPQ